MGDSRIDKLRRDQELVQLPDGSEGVKCTVQFLGDVPPLSRPERRQWLQDHFSEVFEQLARKGITIEPGPLSVSAQTIEAVFPTQQLQETIDEARKTQHRVDVVQRFKATL